MCYCALQIRAGCMIIRANLHSWYASSASSISVPISVIKVLCQRQIVCVIFVSVLVPPLRPDPDASWDGSLVFVYSTLRVCTRAGGPAGQVGCFGRRAARGAWPARHLPLVAAARRDRQQRAWPPVLQGTHVSFPASHTLWNQLCTLRHAASHASSVVYYTLQYYGIIRNISLLSLGTRGAIHFS